MSLSSVAKRNIALSAVNNFLADDAKVAEATTLLATSIIEQEIGYASEDIHPSLFTELVAEIYDPIYTKLIEICQ